MTPLFKFDFPTRKQFLSWLSSSFSPSYFCLPTCSSSLFAVLLRPPMPPRPRLALALLCRTSPPPYCVTPFHQPTLPTSMHPTPFLLPYPSVLIFFCVTPYFILHTTPLHNTEIIHLYNPTPSIGIPPCLEVLAQGSPENKVGPSSIPHLDQYLPLLPILL